MKIKSMLDFPGREPMTKENSEIFIKCMMGELNSGKDWEPDDAPGSEHPGLLILSQRLDMVQQKVSFFCRVFIASICDRPGQVVNYAYALCAIAEKTGAEIVGMIELAEGFPDGFPTEEAGRKCWDSQKQSPYDGDGNHRSDNKYDEMKYWEREA